MRWITRAVVGVAVAAGLGACGGDERPSRAAFVEHLAGGVEEDRAFAECVADVVYDDLSDDELETLMAVDVDDERRGSGDEFDQVIDAAFECASSPS